MYLDLILFLNFVFNFMILSLTTYLARIQTAFYRLLIGTIIATTLVPIILYFPHSFINSFIGKGIYSLFIIVSAFGLHGIQHIIRNLFLFYFTSFSVGGGLFGLHYMIQANFTGQANSLLLSVNNIYGEQISLLLIVIGFPAIWLFTKNRLDRHVKDKIKYDQMYECIVTINEQSHQTIGYIDSGNHLVDPISDKPVIICDERFLNIFFSEQDWSLIRSSISNHELTQFPICIQKRMSIVPFQGVGGSNDFLYTIRPDKLTVFYGEHIIETSNVLIGIQLGTLTADNSYHVLLHPQIIQFSSVKSA